MIDLIKKNRDIGCGFSQRAPADMNEFWEELVLTLNGSGPPLNNSNGWKKVRVWTDYKSGLKKLTKNNRLLTGTGAGPYKEIPLTDTEEVVGVLLNLDTAVYGIANINNFGVSKDALPKRHNISSFSEISLPLKPNMYME